MLLDDDLSQPTAIASDSFRISALQKKDPFCIILSSCISSGLFPTWTEVRVSRRSRLTTINMRKTDTRIIFHMYKILELDPTHGVVVGYNNTDILVLL